MPLLLFIAGSNGAGKTTVARWAAGQHSITMPTMLNADDLAKQKSIDALSAARQIDAALRTELGAGKDIGVETVLSSNKYLSDALTARSRGYLVEMIYVALPSADLAVERVRIRVGKGGHNVSEEKIRDRWEGSHRMLAKFIESDALDRLFVFSNHGPANPPLVAEGRRLDGVFEVSLYDYTSLPRITEALRPFLNATGI